MHRLSATKTCFLSESTENMPKPDDLLKILEYEQVIQVPDILFLTRRDAKRWNELSLT